MDRKKGDLTHDPVLQYSLQPGKRQVKDTPYLKKLFQGTLTRRNNLNGITTVE
jgi:hypothetical protein